MTSKNFSERLALQWARRKFLCVGLDIASSPDQIPKSAWRRRVHGDERDDYASAANFLGSVIAAIGNEVCAIKLNPAFFFGFNPTLGMELLVNFAGFVHEVAPNTLVILDGKYGDVRHTNECHMQFVRQIGADAVTINPYVGFSALEPFLSDTKHGAFVLCTTSNPGADQFQSLITDDSGQTFAGAVARAAAPYAAKDGNVGLVVGATQPDALYSSRQIMGDRSPLLIPGVGVQGGDIRNAVTVAKNRRGEGFIVTVSRAILYASSGDDYAEAALAEVLKLNRIIEEARKPVH